MIALTTTLWTEGVKSALDAPIGMPTADDVMCLNDEQEEEGNEVMDVHDEHDGCVKVIVVADSGSADHVTFQGNGAEHQGQAEQGLKVRPGSR